MILGVETDPAESAVRDEEDNSQPLPVADDERADTVFDSEMIGSQLDSIQSDPIQPMNTATPRRSKSVSCSSKLPS